ncbi:MAG: type II secretion system protein GspD [Candidatus Rokuibacteriota bacterium]|nr:MAG: type II secretion system protein GspD [Candidatus Rokubacteria bacterium]
MPPVPPPLVAPPPATGAPPQGPSTPPLSVGPRTDVPKPEAPRIAAQAPPFVPAAPPTAPPVPPGQRGRFIVLNFDNADIETVVHAASEIVGFNYVIGPGVSGKKVTVQTSGRIPQEDVFGVLLAILEVHGVTAVRSGNLYKIVPVEGARERAVPTIVGATPDPTRTGDEIVTQIVPVRFAAVAELGTLLRPLISARGTLIANRETGVLIITDSASNIARLLDIIKLVDVEVSLDELQIIPLSYADAAEMANLLNQLFQAGRLRTTSVGGAPPPAPAPPGAPAAAGATGGADRPPLIVAERRSNSLIVNARRGELETIRRVIEKLDINVSGGRRVFIYYAENAKSKDLAATLNAIYTGRETVQTSPTPTQTGGSQAARPTGLTPPATPPPPSVAPGPSLTGTADAPLVEGQIRFIADETTNAIIVTTTPRQWADIEVTIRQLDRMPRQVLIEVLVAEITLNDDTRLGLDWAVRAGKFGIANATANTAAGTTALPGAPSATGGSFSGPNISRLPTLFGPVGAGLTAIAFETDRFLAMINVLASESRINIISNPHVMTSENKKAVINVSTSVPVVTGQQAGTTVASTTPTNGTVTPTNQANVLGTLNQTVEYKDAGVVLTVTPRIGERGTVALDVKQEVNSVGPGVPPTGSPSFTKREAETSVVLLNNQTLVLGGLIQDKITRGETGIPGLKNIPILGWFFKSKDVSVQKTELLLVITPRVIGTALDAARITDEMRKTTPELNEAIRSAPRSPRSGVPPLDVPLPLPAPEMTPAVPVGVAPVTPSVAPPPIEPVPVTPAPVAPPPLTPAPSGVPPIPSVPPTTAPGPSSGLPPTPVVPPVPPETPAPAPVIGPAPVITPAPDLAPAPSIAPPAVVTPPSAVAPAPVITPAPGVTSPSDSAPSPGVVAPAPPPGPPDTARPTAPARPPRIGPPIRPRPPLVPPPPVAPPPRPDESAPPPAAVPPN